MKKREKLIRFLLKPPMWICIVVWALCTVLLAGSITLYYMGQGLELWAIPLHIFALVFVLLAVYAALTVIGIPERAKDKPKVQKFFSSYSTRAFVYATGSVIFNICYVVFGVIISHIEHSVWLGVLVGYHVFLILPRIEVLFTAKFRGRDKGQDAEIRATRAYANCGLLLIMLAVAILPVIKLTLDDVNSYRYFTSAVVYVTAIATYTFIKFGIAVYNFKKARRQNDPALIAVKNASFADALISVFTLQAMMLKELGFDGHSFALASKLNPLLGAVISAAIFAIGVQMIVSGRKKLRGFQSENDVANDAPEKSDAE